jgi:hypothetical protein
LPENSSEPASKMLCSFKKLCDGEVLKKKILTVNFFHPMFSVLDFLTFEAATNRLSQNVGLELTAPCCVISQKSAGHT